MQERPGSAALSYLAAGFHAAGRDVVAIDLTLLSGGEDMTVWPPSAPARLACEAPPWSITHVEAVSDRGPVEVRRWAETPGLVALDGQPPLGPPVVAPGPRWYSMSPPWRTPSG